MQQRLVLTATGLQRSGNHAILDWVGSLFPSHHLFNDLPHDTFRDTKGLADLIGQRDEACLIFSFEDSAQCFRTPGLSIAQSVLPFPADHFPDMRVAEIVILRDPYNTWASRVAAHQKFGLTSAPDLDTFMENWLALAKKANVTPESAILFNAWFRSEAYRREICARLGGVYSEETLNEIPAFGRGSSFDGMQRPSYGQILADAGKYLSPDFLRKFADQPADYLRRLVSRRKNGTALKVEERWVTLLEDPGARPLLADERLRDQTRRLFGPAVPLPEMHPQPAA